MLLLLPAGGPQLAVTTDLRTAPVVGLLMASIRRADPGNGSALMAKIFLAPQNSLLRFLKVVIIIMSGLPVGKAAQSPGYKGHRTYMYIRFSF